MNIFGILLGKQDCLGVTSRIFICTTPGYVDTLLDTSISVQSSLQDLTALRYKHLIRRHDASLRQATAENAEHVLYPPMLLDGNQPTFDGSRVPRI
jgi:hypothetical protein